MDRALWLLLALRCRAWFRRLARNARTLRGALVLAAGLVFFVLVIGPNIVAALLQAPHPGLDPADAVAITRRLGPIVLLAYCLLTVLFSSAEQGVSFSPAEVQFLFPGPFSRRQVLAYKVVGHLLLSLLYALFLTAFLLPRAASPGPAYLGLVLVLWFVHLFTLAATLVVQTVGARASTWPRRLVLAAVAVCLLWALLWTSRNTLAGEPRSVLDRVQDVPAVRVMLAPMSWFVQAFTADGLGPGAGFWRPALLALAVNALLFALVFLLDAQYLESAAAASERLYARLQRVRSSGALAATGGGWRLRLPDLPWWGGAGPLAWRQLTAASRGLRPLLGFLVLFAAVAVVPFLVGLRGDAFSATALGPILAGTLLGMTFAVLAPLMTFDFRGDLDRMDVLKTLPVPPAAVAVGQLIAPVLLLSLVQIALVAGVQALWGGAEQLLAGTVAFALPVNFLSLAVENLLFLWFPARQGPSMAGDFHMMGRQALMMLAKFTLLGIGVAAAVSAAAVVYVVLELLDRDGLVPAGAAAWLVLAVQGAALVPLLARAFTKFDVARDTPP